MPKTVDRPVVSTVRLPKLEVLERQLQILKDIGASQAAIDVVTASVNTVRQRPTTTTSSSTVSSTE
jgi:hypothetical protein